MEKSKPLVTIGIPTLNRATYLLDAVSSALSQSYTNIEVVVVDNFSDDDTLSRLDGICDNRLRVCAQSERVDMGVNWNTCLDEASGEYFLMLSDDDLLREDAIEEYISQFVGNEHSAELGIVYSQTRYIDRLGASLGCTRLSPHLQSTSCAIKCFLEGQIDLFPCTTMFRTEDAKRRVGGYDFNRFKWAHDSGMWINVASLYKKVAFIPLPLADYRVHQSNASVTSNLNDWIVGAENVGKQCRQLPSTSGSCEISDKDVKKYLARVVTSICFSLYRSGANKKMIWDELLRYRHYYWSWYGFKRFGYQLFISLLPGNLLNPIRTWFRGKRVEV